MKANQLIHNYQQIWDKFREKGFNPTTQTSQTPLLDRGFVFQFDEGVVEPDVLFLGINPSYKYGSKVEKPFYTQVEALKHAAYFKPFESIANELRDTYKREITWSHMDMLVFRETQQSFIRNVLFKRPLKEESFGVEFLVDQIAISKKILEYLRPKVLIVSNTMARELLGKNRGRDAKGNEFGGWAGFQFKFDKNTGTDIILNSEPLRNTKVFFTSMLSGQRALDNGTKERLIWHINEVLKKRE